MEKDFITVYRGEEYSRINRFDKDNLYDDLGYSGIFFSTNPNDVMQYGIPKVFHISKEAKLYEGSSSREFCIDNNLLEENDDILYKISDGYTLAEIKGLYNRYLLDDMNSLIGAYQYMAKKHLSKNGYDGAHWEYEDDLSPEQYQIWNVKVISYIGDVGELNESLINNNIKQEIKDTIKQGNFGQYLPEFLYHATFSGTLDSIKKNGLGSLKHGYKSLWRLQYEQGVYLDTDAGSAESFVEGSDDDRLDTESVVVFKIPTSKLDHSLLEIDWNNTWNTDIIEDHEFESLKDYFDSITYFYGGVVPFADLILINESLDKNVILSNAKKIKEELKEMSDVESVLSAAKETFISFDAFSDVYNPDDKVVIIPDGTILVSDYNSLSETASNYDEMQGDIVENFDWIVPNVVGVNIPFTVFTNSVEILGVLKSNPSIRVVLPPKDLTEKQYATLKTNLEERNDHIFVQAGLRASDDNTFLVGTNVDNAIKLIKNFYRTGKLQLKEERTIIKFGYRNNETYGSNKTNLLDVIKHETTDLYNVDIPETVLLNFEATDSQKEDINKFITLIDEAECEDCEGHIETLTKIIKKKYPDARHCLWLCDTKEDVKKYYEGTDDNIVTYRIEYTTPISDLGDEGKLYLFSSNPHRNNYIGFNELTEDIDHREVYKSLIFSDTPKLGPIFISKEGKFANVNPEGSHSEIFGDENYSGDDYYTLHDEFGLIKANGSNKLEPYVYIDIWVIPNPAQKKAIIDWMYFLMDNGIKDVQVNTSRSSITYPFESNIPEDIYETTVRTLNEKLNESYGKYLYHATYIKYWEEIQKQGHLGNSKYKNWDMSKSDKVYMANDPEIAASFAETSELYDYDYDDDDMVILQIDVSKLDKSKISIDPNIIYDPEELQDEGERLIYSYEYSGTIPLSALKVIDNLNNIEKDYELPYDIDSKYWLKSR
jgi:hypothetical protein